MDAAEIASIIIEEPSQIRDELANWMQKCRWAGLSGLQYPKDYEVKIWFCQDFSFGDPKHSFLLLGIIITLQNPQEFRKYCLILSVTSQNLRPDGGAPYPLSTFFTPTISQGRWSLLLATLDPHFVLSLLQKQAATKIVRRPDISLVYTPADPHLRSPSKIQEFKVLGSGDTTNSIVRVTADTPNGLQRHVFKAYLRLIEHNIEAEMISHLHAMGFSAVPALEGMLELQWGKSFTLLLVSQFVENEGDGGKPFWDHLQEYLQITQTQKFVKFELQRIGPLAQLVGQTTRDFHNALSSVVLSGRTRVNATSGGMEGQEEKAKIHHAKEMERELKKNLRNAVKLWTQRQPLLFPTLQPDTLILISNDLSLLETHLKKESLVDSIPLQSIQLIHGDLHLGQFLFQSGPPPKFIITDLEGDPQLPPKKRRNPRSVWFDLGGLLRALDYIAFFGALESLKQQVPDHPWGMEDIFALFLVRLVTIPIPPALEQYRWVAESTVVHALEWVEFVGRQILSGYGVKDRLGDELPLTFRLIRATSELNYELGFRGQNALVPLLGVISIGNQWLDLKKRE